MDDEYNIAVWVSSDGKTKLISNMASRYIWNCLGKLKEQLANKPTPEVYMGESEDATELVEWENKQNDELEKKILNKIGQFEAELRKRGELPS
jgi:hypothetical protein